MLFLHLSNPCFLFLVGVAYDEGPNGPLPVSRDSGRSSKGEGRDNGGKVEGAKGLEGGPRK